jgi:hypothetical protein
MHMFTWGYPQREEENSLKSITISVKYKIICGDIPGAIHEVF